MTAGRDTLFFWKPEQEHGFLGQWFPARFVSTKLDGSQITYESTEQQVPLVHASCTSSHEYGRYMMHRKGLLFAPDSEITAEILLTSDAREIKALGRAVPNFDEDIWRDERYDIVVEGNYLKFTQNSELKAQLLGTGDKR